MLSRAIANVQTVKFCVHYILVWRQWYIHYSEVSKEGGIKLVLWNGKRKVSWHFMVWWCDESFSCVGSQRLKLNLCSWMNNSFPQLTTCCQRQHTIGVTFHQEIPCIVLSSCGNKKALKELCLTVHCTTVGMFCYWKRTLPVVQCILAITVAYWPVLKYFS